MKKEIKQHIKTLEEISKKQMELIEKLDFIVQRSLEYNKLIAKRWALNYLN